ncbi:MAG: PadR family transcriptional regulator [Alphaproteobacteria bacterium]|nr:PadR family transcriptional regulator [Alphaproteobacteria bacterium]MBV9542623.1 PadR family transcriptional regulator [Alphaproteobacteria bacterium]MBV9903699.1 PadR family transcriptional regulator [Alphaproteobacteria bacterium]
MKSRKGLTELEGTILGQLKRIGAVTPYRLRKIFAESPSDEWSGSAGAVYPALHRLKARGLAKSVRAADKRGTESYTLTASGARALTDWIGDAARATSPGIDPFRGRAGLWQTLPAAERRALYRELEATIERRLAALAAGDEHRDAMMRMQSALDRALQESRLAWLKVQMRRL